MQQEKTREQIDILFERIRNNRKCIDSLRNSKIFVVSSFIGAILSFCGLACIFQIIESGHYRKGMREVLIAGLIGAGFLIYAFIKGKANNRIIADYEKDINECYDKIDKLQKH